MLPSNELYPFADTTDWFSPVTLDASIIRSKIGGSCVMVVEDLVLELSDIVITNDHNIAEVKTCILLQTDSRYLCDAKTFIKELIEKLNFSATIMYVFSKGVEYSVLKNPFVKHVEEKNKTIGPLTTVTDYSIYLKVASYEIFY